jgi:hypothetical protein
VKDFIIGVLCAGVALTIAEYFNPTIAQRLLTALWSQFVATQIHAWRTAYARRHSAR